MATNQSSPPINLARLYRPLILDGWFEPFQARAMELAGNVLEFLDPELIGYDLVAQEQLAYLKQAQDIGRIAVTQAEVDEIAGSELTAHLKQIGHKHEANESFLALYLDDADGLYNSRRQARQLVDRRARQRLHWGGSDSSVIVAKMSVARPPQGLAFKLSEIIPEDLSFGPAKIVGLVDNN